MRIFKGKHIAILGLSIEGLDAAKFFNRHNLPFTCFDRRNEKELGFVYTELSKLTHSFFLGENYLDYLSDFNIVVRTPGMVLSDPRLRILYRKGINITSVTKLFFDLCTIPIIGITGTKGKGTTSTLVCEMLKASGYSVRLGGNVGKPLLSEIDNVNKDDFVVLELSSFQLEDLGKSPHIAIVLRITSDHLTNYDPLATNYHKDTDAYVKAKKSIVRFQHPYDIVILNADDITSLSFGKETPAKQYTFSIIDTKATSHIESNSIYISWNNWTKKICNLSDIKLRGMHNVENIAAASMGALAAGASLSAICKVATSFKGLEHRLEEIKTVNGVLYVNDTFSTIPETTIAAIRSFNEPLVLIVGGSEKGSDFTQLGQEIANGNIKALIIVGQMTGRILSAVKSAGYNGIIITGCQSMYDIVQQAAQASVRGDVVLLSPACASFDMFKNYKERGMLYKYEIEKLNLN